MSTTCESKDVELFTKVSALNDKIKKCKFAYVTLVMKGDNYLPGALVLAYSLRKCSKYIANGTASLVCMITEDVSEKARDQLKKLFDEVVLVPYISQNCKHLRTIKQQSLYESWLNVAFTKFNILNLVQYDKVMFLDADKIILKNIDHLFDLPTPAGTFSSPWIGVKYSPSFKCSPSPKCFPAPDDVLPCLKAFPKVHGESVPNEAIIQGLKSTFVVIGTTVILTPSKLDYDGYCNMVCNREEKLYGWQNCNSMVDEQSICEYFLSTEKTWTFIHQQYNAIPWHSKWLKGKKPYLFHYFNKKPWNMDRNEWLDISPWWELADSLCHEKKELASVFSSENLFMSEAKKLVGCAWCKEQLKLPKSNWINHSILNCPQIMD